MTYWKAQKEEQARLRKRENDIKKTEEKISELEDRINEINELINLPENSGDHVKLMELSDELQQSEKALEELYEKWEELSS